MQHVLRNAIALAERNAAGGEGSRSPIGARRPWEVHADRAVLLTALFAVLFVALLGA